jgi:excisionase family DNA binding protein
MFPADLEKLATLIADAVTLQTAAMPARYLTIKSAARYTSLSEGSIRSLISTRRLTALRPVAGRVLLDRRELDSVLRSSTRRSRKHRGGYDRTQAATPTNGT